MPRFPRNDDRQFDLAFSSQDEFLVVEFNSITPPNEERQFRLGFG